MRVTTPLHGVKDDVDLDVACVRLREGLDGGAVEGVMGEVDAEEGGVEFERFGEGVDSGVFDSVFREVQIH